MNKSTKSTKSSNNEDEIVRRLGDMLLEKFSQQEKYHKKLFEEHESIIAKLISDDNVMINERLDNIMRDVDDLKTSIQFTQLKTDENSNRIKDIDTKLKLVQKKNVFLKQQISEIEKAKEKIIDLENRSRRNNIRIDSIRESEGETWNDSEEKVKKLLKTVLKIDRNIDIERAHRTGSKRNDRPRIIVLKLLNFKEKEDILSKARLLKGTGVFVNEDFAKETREKRKLLWEEVKKHRIEGKYAVIKYDRVFVREQQTRK